MLLRPLLVALFFATPAVAQDRAVVDRALDAAVRTFESALPSLATDEMGVDVAAYRDALTLQQFSSAKWGGTVAVDLVVRAEASGSCGRFAAFVLVPPQDGVVQMVFCPQFFTEGADGLRQLTLLHEMVHVVAGTDECQAMAFAARVQQAATGAFTPVDRYWRASGCEGSRYALP